MKTRKRAHKTIDPELTVLIDIDGEHVPVGTLSLEGKADNFRASFQYLTSYLKRASEGRAFPLDPINLPLRPSVFTTYSRYHLLGCIFDAAPDAWGRTIMALDEGISPSSLAESNVLLKGKGSGVGALTFTAKTESDFESSFSYRSSLPGIDDVGEIYNVIKLLESGVLIDEQLREMLMSSWDIGGARPKAVVKDKDNNEWIVKFPRSIDTYSRQRVEWANLEMARDVGITVPQTTLYELEGGDCALLVKRFDRSLGVRKHYISAVSLISPSPDFDKRQLDTNYGASIFSYARIAHTIRAVSSNIIRDTSEMFARMVLNVLVNNTDDHLKNTGFLMDDLPNKLVKYRLSPLFDVVTQEGNMKHMLHIGPKQMREGTMENILSGISQWGLKEKAAKETIDLVQERLSLREKYYIEAGMSANEMDSIEKWLNKDIRSKVVSKSKRTPLF